MYKNVLIKHWKLILGGSCAVWVHVLGSGEGGGAPQASHNPQDIKQNQFNNTHYQLRVSFSNFNNERYKCYSRQRNFWISWPEWASQTFKDFQTYFKEFPLVFGRLPPRWATFSSGSVFSVLVFSLPPRLFPRSFSRRRLSVSFFSFFQRDGHEPRKWRASSRGALDPSWLRTQQVCRPQGNTNTIFVLFSSGTVGS